MPIAEVTTDGEREELKTLEGAYVVIKPLPYGERLAMRDRASRMSMEMEADEGNRASRRRRQQQTSRLDFDMMQRNSREYEFAHCIVDHNLEHKDGRKMDFKSPDTLNTLDPRVGSEIEELIDRHNELDTDEELENLKAALTSSTPVRQNSDLKEEPSIPSK